MRSRAVLQRFLSVLVAAAVASSVACQTTVADNVSMSSYDGRSMIVYVPSKLPPEGNRALVVVLHGGLGNAQRIESRQSEAGLNIDRAAERNGFVVAYLNGTPVTRRMGNDKLGWNAGGGCCGLSAENNVDDVGYIKGAINYLVGKYGIDRSRVFGLGHSNGAMMTQRFECETGLYAAAVAISGPLNLETDSCPAARGKRILAIHGRDDENVPIAGGQGIKGFSRAEYHSQERSRKVLTGSGADYQLQVVSGADHKLDNIEAAIQRDEGQTLADKVSRFFGLANPDH